MNSTQYFKYPTIEQSNTSKKLPNVNFSSIFSDEQEQVFDNIENAVIRGDNGFYNITTIATVDEKISDPVDFKCKLEIGDANYEATKGLHYYPGKLCYSMHKTRFLDFWVWSWSWPWPYLGLDTFGLVLILGTTVLSCSKVLNLVQH